MVGRSIQRQPNGRERSDSVVLDVRGLTKVFESGPAPVRAVDGVDFAVRKGEIVLIVGPSGAGKTTLLTLIGGVLRPTSGTVRINGYEITSMKERELPQVRRHLVGFVFQSFSLLESLSALENVEVALNFAAVTGRDAQERATRLLVDLGMEHRLHFKPRALSAGEQQRVAIARALANGPQLILADEPTANLDSEHGHQIVALLREIAKEQSASVVIVSHDHRIREVADRVLRLEDGRLENIDKPTRDPLAAESAQQTEAQVEAPE